MKKHMRFFKVAEAIANTSTYPRVHIGAAIVKRGNVISTGVNMVKSHPFQKKYNELRNFNVEIHHNLHAEMAALLRAGDENLKGAVVYVYRNDKGNRTAMCRPCPACQAALYDRGVREVRYTTEIGFAHEEWV
jgi:deoxycytidylate deaminase